MKPINLILLEVQKEATPSDSAKIGRFMSYFALDVFTLSKLARSTPSKDFYRFKTMLYKHWIERIDGHKLDDERIKGFMKNYVYAKIFSL